MPFSKVAALAALLLICLTAAAAVAARATLAGCRMSQFAVALGPRISEATGQHTLALRLVNRTAAGCVLMGYPDVKTYDRVGSIPFLIRHGGDQMITSHRPEVVVVRSNRAVFVLLNHYRCDLGGLRGATRVSIGLPGAPRVETASVRITNPYRGLDYCGKGDPGSTLTVSPFEPTVRAALRGG
jgi:hypothetical protein